MRLAKSLWIGVVIGAVAICAAVYGTSSAASGSTTAKPVTPVTVRFLFNPTTSLNWIVQVARLKGYFTTQHVNADLVTLAAGGATGMAALASNSIDVESDADLSVVGPYLEKGVQFTAISGNYANGWAVVAGKSADLPSGYPKGIRALGGKTVGVVGVGTSSYYTLRAILSAAGVSPDSVTYASLGATATTGVAEIDSGRITAGAVPPDLEYYLTKVQDNQVLFDSTGVPPSLSRTLLAGVQGKPNTLMWARSNWVAQHRSTVKGIQTAIAQADVWMHKTANFAALVTLLTDNGDIPQFALKDAAPYVRNAISHIAPYYSKADAAAQLKFWERQGLLTSSSALAVGKWLSPTIIQTQSQLASRAAAASTRS